MTDTIAAVAIGRNEGARLESCLTSLLAQGAAPVIYVDSGSADGSTARARDLGAVVVDLDLSTPFTAARARNAGWAHALEIAPETQFVQFIDGDCELAPGWLEAARTAIAADPKLAVICGRRRERFPEATIWIRILSAWRAAETIIPPGKSAVMAVTVQLPAVVTLAVSFSFSDKGA